MKLTAEQSVATLTTLVDESSLPDAQLANNPHASPQFLDRIAASSNWELRRLVASNPNTPTETLWQLGIDFPEAVLANPIFELLQLERLDLASTIPPATLTSLLQCERVPKQFMEYALAQQDYSLWLAVAYNPHTPGHILERLAHKSRFQDRESIRAIAAHPNTPHHLLDRAIDIGSGVAAIVAENPHTPVPVLERILAKYADGDRALAIAVALHPQIDPQLLIKLALAPDLIAAKSLWLAKQPTTTSEVLAELAQTDWDIQLLAIVRHPHAPIATIEKIWSHLQATALQPHPDRAQLDRLIYDSFVGNPQTPGHLRAELRKLIHW